MCCANDAPLRAYAKERMKGSQPGVTLAFAATLLQERPTTRDIGIVILIWVGIAMTCEGEQSAEQIGVLSALLSNVVDAFANVYVKYVLEELRIGPAFLQFYCSAAAVLLFCLPDMLQHGFQRISWAADLSGGLFICGLLCAMQSLIEMFLVDLVGPTNTSILNAVRRVMTFLFATAWFRTPTTMVGLSGSAAVFVGAILYQKE